MQFCLIDSDAGYREMLRYHLHVEWPDATFVEFDCVTEDVPAADTLADCDAVLVGCPQAGQSGFAGLERLLDSAAFPPVVLFASEGDEFLAVDAIKAGAASYFPKDRVTFQRLTETLRSELGAQNRQANPNLTSNHGQYKIIRELHSTDLATVYLSETDSSDGLLVIKVIRYVPDAGSEHLFDRFLQEYEIIAGIDHPNVVRIFDLGIADDHAFIAMEYLGGGRLSDRLGNALKPALAIEYLRQIGSALDAIHGTGILHRDLKPANIMFRDDDSIALIDFGLAKWMKLEAALTGHGQIFGTPYYMSPEQGHGEPTDQRTDIYSLGCVLHEMLTGQRPFTSSNAMGVIYQHANSPRPRLESKLTVWQPLLDRMLAVDPADRFASAGELLNAIEEHKIPEARRISPASQ